MRKIPIMKLLMLKDLDRVSVGFWPVCFAIIFILLGFNLPFLRLFAWVGLFILLFYALFIALWVKNL